MMGAVYFCVQLRWLMAMILGSNCLLLAAEPLTPPKEDDCLRFATFNCSLSFAKEGELEKAIVEGDSKVIRVARIIRLVRPDVVLLNEFDYAAGRKLDQQFVERYLAGTHRDIPEETIEYPYQYSMTVNTGEPSGLDLNRDGKFEGPNDAWGFGNFRGQYGMLVLSRFPIEEKQVRTFQKLRWATMPNARRPVNAKEGFSYYSDDLWAKLRLPSKSLWDIPIRCGNRTIHLVASHPTPPVFDGPEDRNGCRNADEIRLLEDFVTGGDAASYIEDDAGTVGGLEPGTDFVIAGDLNSDPNDGDGIQAAIASLLGSQRVAVGHAPRSRGAIEAAKLQGGANERQKGDAALDTGDFGDQQPGNLRIDFVLPSRSLRVKRSGVFWPTTDELQGVDSGLVEVSDHRLVWVDVAK